MLKGMRENKAYVSHSRLPHKPYSLSHPASKVVALLYFLCTF